MKALKSEFGSTVAGGQGQLKGKIFRVAHLGYYDATDIFGLLSTLEIVLTRLGHRFELGAGLAAAEAAYLRRHAARPELSNRILVLEGITDRGLEILKAEGWDGGRAQGDAAGRAGRPDRPYHALMIRSGSQITAEVLDAAANLRIIGRPGVGVDNVDLDAATRRGVVVMNSPRRQPRLHRRADAGAAPGRGAQHPAGRRRR